MTPQLAGRLAVRTKISNTAPYVLWLVPCAVGAFDAANVIDAVAAPVYNWLTVAAATVTILARGPRVVRDLLAQRWDHAAEQAQVKAAALQGYRMHAEHCETHLRADRGELRRAVGGDPITAPLPNLHVVRDDDGEHSNVFNQAVTIGRAAVPPQSQPGGRLAAARRPRSDA